MLKIVLSSENTTDLQKMIDKISTIVTVQGHSKKPYKNENSKYYKYRLMVHQ